MIVFEGKNYYRDKATGYYRSHMRDPDRDYLHRAVWRSEYGNIPHGWEVHHWVDDRGTTDTKDLSCMPFREHLALHKETQRANGHKTKHVLRIKHPFVCDGCGQSYQAEKRRVNRWCSQSCANRYWNSRSIS